jgi:acyl carrier protein
VNTNEIRALVLRLLAEIVPEAGDGGLRDDVPLRDQLDLDSMDFLNFIIALDRELKIEVPESDYPRLATIEGATSYLGNRLATR